LARNEPLTFCRNDKLKSAKCLILLVGAQGRTLDPLIKRLMLSQKNQLFSYKAQGFARTPDQWLIISLQKDLGQLIHAPALRHRPRRDGFVWLAQSRSKAIASVGTGN
jgi:hypothetical protein